MRTFVIVICLALLACGEEGLRRSVVGRPVCVDDSACASGLMCIDGTCAALVEPQSVPVSSSGLLESVGQSPFASQSGSFTLKFTVASTRAASLIDTMSVAKLRARFVDGGVHLWGLEIDTPGGPVVIPTSDGDRLYYVSNVRVRSLGEIVLPLASPETINNQVILSHVLAMMDVDVSADVGANETDSVRLSARLDRLPCQVEFFAGAGSDKRLHARLVVAVEGGLYGPPGSGLSIDGMAVDADLAGALIP